ncbi:MAG: glutathione S-transferase family protein [Rhodocyclaceae bacterium]|nr:glutathione S-transferase family protein [Rhodocyclaceae bacterium]MBX3666964.1 glutathione S-transferase family protein [Rhodocyclaceae bacterium]
MMRLFQFPPALGLPNASPFCLKLETYLRMAGLPYENRYTLDLHKAPKGKLPYIDDGGRIVADSGLAIDYLKKTYGDVLDVGLTAQQAATGLLLRRLLEEHLYWCVVYFRWSTEAGWALTRVAFFGALKPPLAWIVPRVARRTILRQLTMQGIGRHTEDEIVQLGIADLDAVAALLGQSSYMLGEQPSSVDACAYGFLANLIAVPLDMPLKRHAQRHANLVAYYERMRARYWA